MAADDIVTIYSAKDATEAHMLCDALAQEGIQAQVVGEDLAAGRGKLPFGWVTDPKIWVFKKDEFQARKLLALWTSQSRRSDDFDPFDDEDAETESAEPAAPAEEQQPLLSDVRFGWTSQGFYILAFFGLVAGAIWAWQNWMTLQDYSASTTGMLVRANRDLDRPLPQKRRTPALPRPRYRGEQDGWYTYRVDGHDYRAVPPLHKNTPEEVLLLYRPAHPDQYMFGPITPPWMTLVFASACAAFLAFLGYQFR